MSEHASFFASDTFRRGGDLVDIDRWYAGRDKLQHLVCGAALFLLLRRWLLPGPWALFAVLVGGLLWECYEWSGLSRRFRDRPSWRDVVADMLGAALAWLLL